jgi:hypothetical protein
VTINELLAKGILVKQPTSKEEIDDLLQIVARDLEDSSQTEISLLRGRAII